MLFPDSAPVPTQGSRSPQALLDSLSVPPSTADCLPLKMGKIRCHKTSVPTKYQPTYCHIPGRGPPLHSKRPIHLGILQIHCEFTKKKKPRELCDVLRRKHVSVWFSISRFCPVRLLAYVLYLYETETYIFWDFAAVHLVRHFLGYWAA